MSHPRWFVDFNDSAEHTVSDGILSNIDMNEGVYIFINGNSLMQWKVSKTLVEMHVEGLNQPHVLENALHMYHLFERYK